MGAALAIERAELTRQGRQAWLRTTFKQSDLRREALCGLADLLDEALSEFLTQALKEPVSGMTSQALKIIATQAGGGFCEDVYRLFRRLDPNGPMPTPHVWEECLKYLLIHGWKPEKMKAAIALAGGTEIADAALLALEHAPEHALSLFRRALRSDIPINRITAAAILAIIDRPWSRAELLAILRESDDQEGTAECRAALRESNNAESRARVDEWECQNPHEPETDPFFSMKEVMLRSCAESVRWEMEVLNERVIKLRDQIPVESAATVRPWWKLW